MDEAHVMILIYHKKKIKTRFLIYLPSSYTTDRFD